jgi:hypothetical protein
MAIVEKEYEIKRVRIITKDNENSDIVCFEVDVADFIYFNKVIKLNEAIFKMSDITKFAICKDSIKTMFIKIEHKKHSEIVKEFGFDDM